MSNDLNRLYSSVIKSHNESPFHFEKKNDTPVILKAYNPVCGDRFEFYMENNSGKINDISFHGFGCAISKASASVMVKSLYGKTINEALGICNKYLDYIDKKSGDSSVTLPEEFLAFSGVHDFPERYDCATLSWKEMKKYLETALRK